MTKPKPKRFVFDLGDDRRAALEAYRARSGLRSLTEALHRLIDNAALMSAAGSQEQKPHKTPVEPVSAQPKGRGAVKPAKAVRDVASRTAGHSGGKPIGFDLDGKPIYR